MCRERAIVRGEQGEEFDSAEVQLGNEELDRERADHVRAVLRLPHAWSRGDVRPGGGSHLGIVGLELLPIVREGALEVLEAFERGVAYAELCSGVTVHLGVPPAVKLDLEVTRDLEERHGTVTVPLPVPFGFRDRLPGPPMCADEVVDVVCQGLHRLEAVAREGTLGDRLDALTCFPEKRVKLRHVANECRK